MLVRPIINHFQIAFVELRFFSVSRMTIESVIRSVFTTFPRQQKSFIHD